MPNKQILTGHAKTNYKARMRKELWFHRHKYKSKLTIQLTNIQLKYNTKETVT